MANSGSISLDDSALRLRSDRYANPRLAVQYDSANALIKDVIRVYRAHFRTFVAIYLLPIVPFASAAMLLETYVWTDATRARGTFISWGLTFLGGTFAFAAIAVAVSDVCGANRPSVRRSYRRIFGMRFGVVVANTLLYYAAVLTALVAPFLLVFFLPILWLLVLPVAIVFAAVTTVHYIFVPVISAIEPRPGIVRAFRRSASLGRGHRSRTFAMLLCVALLGSLVALLLQPFLPRVIDILVTALIFPPFYIAVVLQYYDLRARKEGFRLIELPEDIV